jgi:CRISPR-associated protein Csd1
MEQGVTRPRAALIKMVLLSRMERADTGGEGMSELDTGNSDSAYLCGRLFAELEAAQHAALGDVGATIVDRYYGTASSAPATVFGRLVRGVQPHLAKLRRDRRGAYHAIDQRLQEILEGLEGFPTTLTLEQQGRFALGYYHQRAADRLAARTRREQRGHEDDLPQTPEEE